MKKILMVLVMALSVSACSDDGPVNHTRGFYMLIDTSGTYTKEVFKAQQIINFILADLQPGDSFAVARIDSGSFSEKDIVAKVQFDSRPTVANEQKRKFKDKIDKFAKTVKGSSYTDITGGMLQAIEYLTEAGNGKKSVIIFSDLKEEIRKGHVRDISLPLQGFNVMALNVTKLRSDNVDPREYLDRIDYWRSKVESAGGTWKVINDMERLEPMIRG